jgi:hypothetical protein
VPVTPLVVDKATEVAPPEQKFWVVGFTTTFGAGFTVTVAVPGVLAQVDVTAVIEYTAVPFELVVVLSV